MTTDTTTTSNALARRESNGDALAAARSWVDMSADERKRAAAEAAGARDADRLVDLALAYQALKRKASERTRETYAWSIRRLVDAWAHVPLLRATPDDADLYRAELEQRYTVATVRVHLAAAEALYRALRWAGATTAAPFADVRPQKGETRAAHERRDRFTEAEVGALLEHARALPDRVVVLLGSRAGLRLGEMLGLRWVDVHTDAGTPHVWVVRGKGGRDRRVVLTPSVVEALDALRAETLDALRGGAATGGVVLTIAVRGDTKHHPNAVTATVPVDAHGVPDLEAVRELVDDLDDARVAGVHATGDHLVPYVVLDGEGRKVGDAAVHVLPWHSPSRTRQRLRNVAKRAGVALTRGKSVHSLRHAAGTAVYGRTRDLLKVAQHLGHRSTATSSVYVARAAEDELYRDLLDLPPLPGLTVSPATPVTG